MRRSTPRHESQRGVSQLWTATRIAQPLNPGDRIEYTLGFDTLEENEQANITIVLKPTGTDANGSNNATSRTIEIREAQD